MTGAQLFCLVIPAVLVAAILFFFFRSTSRFQPTDLTGAQKTLHFLLGLIAGTGAAGLLFLIPANDIFVYVLLVGLFGLVDLLALILGWSFLRGKWQFVGFGLLAAAVIIPVLLIVRLDTLPPYTPIIFH